MVVDIEKQCGKKVKEPLLILHFTFYTKYLFPFCGSGKYDNKMI